MTTTLLQKTTPEIAVMAPTGSINALNADTFKTELISSVTHNPVVLLNLQNLDFLDSAGLMAIVAAYRLAQSMGKKFGLCTIAPSVKIIFELTQLDVVFDIFENREQFELSLTHQV